MRARALVGSLALAGVLAVSAGALAPAPAEAIDQSKGRPGFCPSHVGVTVVVDFGQLGGQTIVRCYPSGTRGTGLDALKGAGFQIEGVQRWGEAFICRIENRPSANETIPISGNPGYREMCLETPPASGYWSYWHAGNNCAWEYSQWGLKNRDFIPGGFEGWSFSLNATAESNPKPRVSPVRPGTANQPCNATNNPAPSTNNPNETQPAPTTARPPAPGPSSSSPSASGPGAEAAQPERTGPTTAPGAGNSPEATGERPEEPSEETDEQREPDEETGPEQPERYLGPDRGPGEHSTDASFTGGEHVADVRDVLREESGAAPWAPALAAVLIGALGVGAVLVSLRRKRMREA